MAKSLFHTTVLYCIFEDPASLDADHGLPEDVRYEATKIREHLHKMHKYIAKTIFRSGGVIYGGFVRDTILGVMPRDIDCKVSSERCADDIVHRLNEQFEDLTFIAQSQSTRTATPLQNHYAFSRIMVSTVEMPDIVVQVDVSLNAGNVTNIDFDVNTLVIIDDTRIAINRGRGHPIVGLNMIDLIQRIKERKFSLLCQNPAEEYTTECHQCIDFMSPYGHKIMERIQKMEKRGWTLTGHNTCKNPSCILASTDAHARIVAKLHTLHAAYAQILADEEFKTPAKCDYLSKECISFVENWK